MNFRRFAFAAICVVLLHGSVTAAEPEPGRNASSQANSPHRSLSAIQVDVHNALRAEAATRRAGSNVPEVVRLIDLYREMAGHPKRRESGLLNHLGLQVRSRLNTVSDRIERQIARQEKRIKKPERLRALARPEADVLAQQFGAAGPAQAAPSGVVPPGAGAVVDYGPELVDVIQRTISPETWDINGGLGAVVYFAPRHALVVSAPATVQGQVADLLFQLRAAP
jgi:hypothetical protein